MPPLKITTLNVNGLRSAERKGFRDWLDAAKPDVLCLQEIRCDEETAPEGLWQPKGFHAAWLPAQKKGYAGTSVWAKKKHGEVRFTHGLGHGRGDEEGRAVCAHLPGPGGGVDVWSLYVPSGSSGPERQAWKYEMMVHLEAWFAQLLASGRPTVVCGDVNIAHKNIDLKNWRSNQKNSGFLPDERAFLDRLLASGWRDTFREANPSLEAYSWWSNRGNARANDVGWRIDYVLATPGIRVHKSSIQRDADLSDHAPVSTWIDIVPT